MYAQETSDGNWRDRDDNNEFNISNYRDFLFEITPKLSFQFMAQLKEYIHSGMKAVGPVGKVQEVDEDDDMITGMEKRKKLEDLAKVEAQQNQRKISECKGEVISFGTEVGFKHLDSGYFLAGDKDASGAVNTGYKCLLRHEFSAASVFELSSFYKSKKNGDAIYHSNVVIIRNNYNNCCLSFDGRSHLRFNYPLVRRSEDPLRPDTFHRDPFCKLRNTFYSTEVAIGWSFDKFVDNQPFLKSLKLGSPIRGLDLVQIYHPELKAELCSDVIYSPEIHELTVPQPPGPHVYFRAYNGSIPQEENSLHGLWQIEHRQPRNQGAYFEAIEHNEEVVSNSPTTNHFRLRHFVTGRLLTVCIPEKSSKDPNYLYLLRESSTAGTINSEPDPEPDKSEPQNSMDIGDVNVGGMMQKDSDEDGEKGKSDQQLVNRFNFEFVIMEEQYLRNKCLVYLQCKSSLGTYLRSVPEERKEDPHEKTGT